MIPEGTYRAKAREAALTQSSQGKRRAEVVFDILDDAYAGESLTWYGYLTERAAKRTYDSLAVCGWDGESITQLSGVTSNEVNLVIEHEEYEGKTSARVKWINKLGGIDGKKKIQGAEAASADRELAASIAEWKAGRASSANGKALAEQAKPKSTKTDDPIPF